MADPARGAPSTMLAMAQSIASNTPSRSGLASRGEEIFLCPQVKVYFIKPDANVATSEHSVRLRIVKVSPEDQDGSRPPAFLEVGDILYPLIHSHSPVFLSPEGYYLFPDLSSHTPGASIGLVFPGNVSDAQRRRFETIIHEYSGTSPSAIPTEFGNASHLITAAHPRTGGPAKAHTIEPCPLGPVSPDLANRIAIGIVAVAEVTSRTLSAGAVKTAQLLDKGSNYLKDQLVASVDPVEVQAEIKDAVNTVKTYSGKAVELSTHAIEKLTEATIRLAKFCAFYCQAAASTAVSRLTGDDESQPNSHFDQALVVTEGCVNGVTLVLGGLHHASRVLADSITFNTVQIMDYCYGHEAGEITEGAIGTVTNVTNIGLHATYIQPGNLIRRSTTEAGKALFVKAVHPAPMEFGVPSYVRNLNPF